MCLMSNSIEPLAELLANAPAQPAAQVQPLAVADLPVQSTKKVVLQPLAALPAQAAKQVLELPAQAPLAELLPAQAAAELVQPGAESKRWWTRRTRTRRRRSIRIQKTKTSVQPLAVLAELQHRWPRIRQPVAELQHRWPSCSAVGSS